MYRRVPEERVWIAPQVRNHYANVGARELAVYMAYFAVHAEIGEESFVGTNAGHGWIVTPVRLPDNTELELVYWVPPGAWYLKKLPPLGQPPHGPRRRRRR